MTPDQTSPHNAPTPGTRIGRVAPLWRYPVKSMAAEALEAVDVSWHGLAGDRRWAFVRGGVQRSGFPWLTIRERPGMGLYRPRFVELGRPDASPTRVRTPAGRDLDVLDPALADELGHDARVIKQDRGVFDTFPLSLITQTVTALGAMLGSDLDPLRFRPNLLVEPATHAAFQEDAWVRSVLRIGGFAMRIDKRDSRCAVVNVDPLTARSAPATLRTIVKEREGCLGVYGSTVRPGHVAIGDLVYRER